MVEDIEVKETAGMVLFMSKYLPETNNSAVFLKVPGGTISILFRERIGAILSGLVRVKELVGVTYHKELNDDGVTDNIGHDLWYIEQPKDFKKRHAEAVRQAEAILLRASLGLTESQKPDGQGVNLIISGGGSGLAGGIRQ